MNPDVKPGRKRSLKANEGHEEKKREIKKRKEKIRFNSGGHGPPY
jgi:hypothetical protein